MGLAMELEFEKQCSVGLSPKTVLPPNQHCTKVEYRNTEGKLAHRDDLLSIEEDLNEISFSCYRGSSCKSIRSRPIGFDGTIELKRGSVYQSSGEVRKMKKMETVEGRRKIEMSHSSDSSLSYRIFDSLCSSDEERPQKKSPVMSLNSDSSITSVSKPDTEPFLLDGFLEISLSSDNRDKESVQTVDRKSTEEPNFRCDHVVRPLKDGNDFLEKEAVHKLHKSLSAKVEMPHSPAQSESAYSRVSPKARFSPIRKLFDPFVKSKSQRSPLGYTAECGDFKTTGMANMGMRTLRKSLLRDFSTTEQNSESDTQFVKKDCQNSVLASSPAHLHGSLKLKNKQGLSFFEFSLKCPEDILVAKTWKTENAVNWVYTFHSIHNRKKASASGWGMRDSNKVSSMVGQMQVSCYLCSQHKDGIFQNSMLTEFVLFDIAHAKKSVATLENSGCSPDVVKPLKGSYEGLVGRTFKLDDESDPVKLKHQKKHACNSASLDSSSPYPWAPEDLHPNLEIAAIVIQVPFEKSESLNYKREDKISDKAIPNLLDLSMVNLRKMDDLQSTSLAKVNVVIPTGNHGLPSAESQGPSPLLHRWRLGGGCDCGGWDMACPLTVICNPNVQSAEDHPLTESQWPLNLFVQGEKENTPALTITAVEEGHYAVDFHAQLSTLQAFSICVAILHGSGTATGIGQERNKQLLQCNSLKVLIDEEVKFLIETVTEEKRKVTEAMEEQPPPFVLNPPFSPIARV